MEEKGPNKVKPLRLLLWVLVGAALISALVVGYLRIKVESNYKNVNLVLDYDAFKELARSQSWNEDDVLKKFKDAGITGLAFSETNVDKLKLDKYVRVYSAEDMKMLSSVPVPENIPAVRFIIADKQIHENLSRNLEILFGTERVRAESQDVKGAFHGSIDFTADPKELSFLGLGFLKSEVEIAPRLGFNVVLRPEAKDSYPTDSILRYFEYLKSFPKVSCVVFGGVRNQAAGYPDFLDQTADGIASLGCQLGMIEVPQVQLAQKGVRRLALKLKDKAVRVQSISQAYMQRLNSDETVDIFDLGVRERNMRVLYLRPFTTAQNGKNLLETNIEYFSNLKKELTAQGFTLGEAGSLNDFSPPSILFVIICTGAAASGIILLEVLFGTGEAVSIILLITGIIITALAFFSGHLLIWRKLMALAAGMSLPTIAIATSFPEFAKLQGVQSPGRIIGRATWLLIRISLVSIAGGIFVMGLLSSALFMLQVDQLSGIKLLMIVPVIIVIFDYLLKGAPVKKSFEELMKIPMFLWHVIIIIVLLGAGAIYILRTGNAPETPASEYERTIRNFLDSILVARPRFKEFLIGHPGLMLASALSSAGIYGGIWVLMMITAIGQVDIVDSFGHIHTSLIATFIRVFNGIILGWFFGIAAILIFWVFSRRIQRSPQAK
ncbi:MAG: DUF5693 family protein [Firmicutes bacterium]|nr:DUF5693 family protein [Bacillota bacterium]